jgi:hypothetical protein
MQILRGWTRQAAVNLFVNVHWDTAKADVEVIGIGLV